MKLRFEKPKGQRLHKRFVWISQFEGFMWADKSRKWVRIENIPKIRLESYSSCAPCKSVKAFRRHLKKHPEIKGKAVLVNRFVGYNVYG